MILTDADNSRTYAIVQNGLAARGGTRYLGAMTEQLLSDIDAFRQAHRMGESTFGRKAVNDWRFVRDLRGGNREKPRRVWPETERAVRTFMATYNPSAA